MYEIWSRKSNLSNTSMEYEVLMQRPHWKSNEEYPELNQKKPGEHNEVFSTQRRGKKKKKGFVLNFENQESMFMWCLIVTPCLSHRVNNAQQILQERQSGPRAEILTVTPPPKKKRKDITAALISLTTWAAFDVRTVEHSTFGFSGLLSFLSLLDRRAPACCWFHRLG